MKKISTEQLNELKNILARNTRIGSLWKINEPTKGTPYATLRCELEKDSMLAKEAKILQNTGCIRFRAKSIPNNKIELMVDSYQVESLKALGETQWLPLNEEIELSGSLSSIRVMAYTAEHIDIYLTERILSSYGGYKDGQKFLLAKKFPSYHDNKLYTMFLLPALNLTKPPLSMPYYFDKVLQPEAEGNNSLKEILIESGEFGEEGNIGAQINNSAVSNDARRDIFNELLPVLLQQENVNAQILEPICLPGDYREQWVLLNIKINKKASEVTVNIALDNLTSVATEYSLSELEEIFKKKLNNEQIQLKELTSEIKRHPVQHADDFVSSGPIVLEHIHNILNGQISKLSQMPYGVKLVRAKQLEFLNLILQSDANNGPLKRFIFLSKSQYPCDRNNVFNLIKSKDPNFKVLELIDEKIDDAYFNKLVAELKHNRYITHVDLSANNITHQSLPMVIELLKNNLAIIHFAVWDNPVSNDYASFKSYLINNRDRNKKFGNLAKNKLGVKKGNYDLSERNLKILPKSNYKIQEFCEAIGYQFSDLELLKIVLTRNTNKGKQSDKFENLEFIGDKLLDTIVVDLIYDKSKKPHQLTQEKRRLVKNIKLYKLALFLRINFYLVTPKPEYISIKQLADIVEVLLAAIHEDYKNKLEIKEENGQFKVFELGKLKASFEDRKSAEAFIEQRSNENLRAFIKYHWELFGLAQIESNNQESILSLPKAGQFHYEKPQLDRALLRAARADISLNGLLQLITKGANPYLTDKEGKHLLMLSQRPEVVNFLVLQRRFNINKPDNAGRTALHYAVFQNNLEKLSTLLNLGADPNKADNSGYLPLHHAILQKNLELINALLPVTHLWLQTKQGDDIFSLTESTQDDGTIQLVKNYLNSESKKQDNKQAFFQPQNAGEDNVQEKQLSENAHIKPSYF